MPKERSCRSPTALSSGCQKLGQPVPLSNLVLEENSGNAQAAHVKTPARFSLFKGLVNGRCRGVATRYLGNYLGWHRAMLRQGFTGKALLDRALA